MLVASWGDRAKILGSAGIQHCTHCNNDAEQFLIEVRKKIKLMFVPVGSFPKGKFVVCPICNARRPVDDAEAAEIVRKSLL